MPVSRPVWKGQLRLSLVAIAVELYPATKPNARPSFRQIHEPSGKPINYEKVVPRMVNCPSPILPLWRSASRTTRNASSDSSSAGTT